MTENPLQPQPILYFSPFKGLTQKQFRDVYLKYFNGFDRVYAPFISGVHPIKVNLNKFSDVIPPDNHGVAVIPQFVGTDANEIVAISNTLYDFGGYKLVNWNLGCPFPQLTRKLKGCGILPFPAEIKKTLDRVIPQLKPELSIKTRLGHYNSDEIFSVLEILDQYPLHEIIIHARTGIQLYGGTTHIDGFKKCLEERMHPIIYNGDIFSKTDFNGLLTQFPNQKAWMLGRGALVNPFLPSQIKGEQLPEDFKRERITLFFQELAEKVYQRSKNPRQALGFLKAVWFYTAGCFEDGKNMYSKLKLCNTFDSYNIVAHELLQLPIADDVKIKDYIVSGLARQIDVNSIIQD